MQELSHIWLTFRDSPIPPNVEFIGSNWDNASKHSDMEKTLILDEVQKIPGWSEVVKKRWDEDKRLKRSFRVVILGSSSLLIEKGLSESLTGRFEVNYFPHWVYSEVHNLCKASIEQYTYFGGYPKAYDFLDDIERGANYINSSILEPTLGRDILVMHSVQKPALLRQLFWYISRLPCNIVSYEKILGHLQGRGNSSTIVHYADLLKQAFILVPISKFTIASHRTKKSVPKWILPNPALIDPSIKESGIKGFVFENLIGSHILNLIYGNRNYELMFWREDNSEIDFIITKSGKALIGIEVKSGRMKKKPRLSTLRNKGISCDISVVNSNNIETFLLTTSIDEILSIL